MNQPVADPIDWLKKNLSIDEGLWVKILQRFIPGQSITLAEFLDQKKDFIRNKFFQALPKPWILNFFGKYPSMKSMLHSIRTFQSITVRPFWCYLTKKHQKV